MVLISSLVIDTFACIWYSDVGSSFVHLSCCPHGSHLFAGNRPLPPLIPTSLVSDTVKPSSMSTFASLYVAARLYLKVLTTSLWFVYLSSPRTTSFLCRGSATVPPSSSHPLFDARDVVQHLWQPQTLLRSFSLLLSPPIRLHFQASSKEMSAYSHQLGGLPQSKRIFEDSWVLRSV
jgi:hypothetical protein